MATKISNCAPFSVRLLIACWWLMSPRLRKPTLEVHGKYTRIIKRNSEDIRKRVVILIVNLYFLKKQIATVYSSEVKFVNFLSWKVGYGQTRLNLNCFNTMNRIIFWISLYTRKHFHGKILVASSFWDLLLQGGYWLFSRWLH